MLASDEWRGVAKNGQNQAAKPDTQLLDVGQRREAPRRQEPDSHVF
jgi:hypothetical protein